MDAVTLDRSCDSLQAIVLRNPSQIGVFAANRHESRDIATEREISLLRQVASHVRRASRSAI
jgi:hypothetical protein